MKSVTKKLKNKETKSSLLDWVSDDNKTSKRNNSKKLKYILPTSSVSNVDKRINSKIINKKIKNVKKTKQPLTSSLLLMTNLENKENKDQKEEKEEYDEDEKEEKEEEEKDDNDDDEEEEEKKEESEEDEEYEIYHEPEIFINTQFESALNHSYDIAMLELSQKSAKSISHKNPSLEEFLDIWDNEWSDQQILSYFTKYLSDPRIIVLDKIYNDINNDTIIPKEIWQIIVQFEFGSAKKQIKRRYYHWISQQRKQIYWIPFILGSIQCFGVFFVLFYVFVSGTSLHDAADIGAADITNNDEGNNNNNNNIDTDNNNNNNINNNDIINDDNNDNISDNVETNSFGDLIKFYCALMTVIAAVIQIIGALRSYYLAQFRYNNKLKRFKRIIHLQTNINNNNNNNNNKNNKNKNKNKKNDIRIDIELQIEEKTDNDDNDDNDDDDDDDEEKKNDDDDIDNLDKYGKVRDLPNVEINFDINQVPKEFRHIFLMQNQQKNRRNNIHSNYEDIDSDSEDSINSLSFQHKEVDNDEDIDNDNYEILRKQRLRWKQRKRLNYMMGVIDDRQEIQEIIDDDDDDQYQNDDNKEEEEDEEEEEEEDDDEDDNDDDDEDNNNNNDEKVEIYSKYGEDMTSLEEMQLILSGWESYISFQRWINLSSLVVTDNLSDPYLICFVLHKYFYVLCISTYVFGQNLTTFESLLPFILLFLSFSYLGLIVLDRISAKRAILYILSMIGCCGIIIGIFAGILFLLSYLFYTDIGSNTSTSTSIDNIYNNTTTTNDTTFIFDEYTTTAIDEEEGYQQQQQEQEQEQQNEDDGDDEDEQQQTWWITDFFYPILAFILCSNTIRRIRNGFENNIPEIKYTLWSNCCFVSLIMTFATNSATWSNAEVKAAFLLIFVYMGYLWAQMRLHQAVTRLKKIDYANKYLQNSKWVKKQLFWSWLGQLSNQFE